MLFYFAQGEIPATVGNLKRLKVLNFAGNSFSGAAIPMVCEGAASLIPVNFVCKKLEQLNLSMNKFEGNFVGELRFCSVGG